MFFKAKEATNERTKPIKKAAKRTLDKIESKIKNAVTLGSNHIVVVASEVFPDIEGLSRKGAEDWKSLVQQTLLDAGYRVEVALVGRKESLEYWKSNPLRNVFIINWD